MNHQLQDGIGYTEEYDPQFFSPRGKERAIAWGTSEECPCLLADSSADGGGYWSAAADGELRFQRCSACETFRHYPSRVCPNCQLVPLHLGALGRYCGQPRILCNLDAPPEALLAGLPVRIWFERRGDIAVPQGAVGQTG